MTEQLEAPKALAGTTWEGTWDEISEQAESLSGLRLRLEVLGPADNFPGASPSKARKPTGRGRFAGILSSDDIMRYKREDLALEERRR